jgi:hypothetical protein
MRGKKPNCYDCAHRRSIPGDCHSGCANREAKVSGHPNGIRHGWFSWPYNFDPTWLMSCDGFKALTLPPEARDE